MKIRVIVNPNAGRRIVQQNLQGIIGKLLLEGTASIIQVTRTEGEGDAMRAAAKCTGEDTDLIIACGGDGTVNEVANGLMQSGSNIPLAILAAGTSNDFAYAMHLPDTVDDFCQMVADNCYQAIDIGLANDSRYFVNVASFGIFTDISHKTPRDAKNNLGKFAYYLQAASSAPSKKLKSSLVSISTADETFTDEVQLAIVANSMSVGTFRKLMYQASVSDGLFDVLLLKKKSILSFTAEELRSRIVSGELFQSPGVRYLQTSSISFQPEDDNVQAVDLDGEDYGQLPLSIKVCPKAVCLMVPQESMTP